MRRMTTLLPILLGALSQGNGGCGGGYSGGYSGGTSSSGGRSHRDRVEAVWKAPLYRDPACPFEDARGDLVLARMDGVYAGPQRPEGDYFRLRFRVRGVPPVFGLSAEVDSPEGAAGTPVPFTTDDRGRATATVVIDLLPDPSFRRIVVRDGSGNPLLRGAVPYASERASASTETGVVEGGGGEVRARIVRRVSSRSGRESLSLKIRGLPRGEPADLWLEEGAAGFVVAMALAVGGDGDAELRWDSRDAAPLPLGRPSVYFLSGDEFEIRVDGVPVLEGMFP